MSRGKRCTSAHRPGARWFGGEDRTVTCELVAGHLATWHRSSGFEWDDEHAEPGARVSGTVSVEHPKVHVSLGLSDAEMVALGAYIIGDRSVAYARPMVMVGLKVTKLAADIARIAVEHYEREVAADD